MLSTKRSTASICARKSRSSRWVAIASGLVRYLSSELGWKPRLTSGAGAPPRARYNAESTNPFVRFATGRAGATSRTRVKSNGPATPAREWEGERAGDHRDGVDRERAVTGHGEQRHDPAQAPAEQLDGRAAAVLADALDRRGR